MWSYQHPGFSVYQLPALNDNYIYLIDVDNSDIMAAVDPADAAPVRKVCRELGKPLTHILNTHHHWDHTDGNKPLKSSFACQVVGAAGDAARIPEIDIEVSEESRLQLGGIDIRIIFVPGHTRGHIAFLLKDALFCGDTLFGGGCGRLFEGTPGEMWSSLSRLAALDDATQVYCAHEYTLANLRFARSVDPDNRDLDERISSDTRKRMAQLPTIPSTIGIERATNPFLRPADNEFCTRYATLHSIPTDALSVFTHLRASKDRA
ncbi:MAG: hydroxyacylglutathione hydrolase [Mariprofundaceae bacterium]|nr:hydroxyacylglutathione hydrolase [Mariprofundaceae bacterium]